MSIREMPRLLAMSWRLVRSTSPRDFAISIGLQLIVGLAFGGLLLAGRGAIGALLAADLEQGSLANAMRPMLVAAGWGLVSRTTNAVQSERSKLLAFGVTEAAREHVLDAMANVDLRSFDDPAFYDRFLRAEVSAERRPYELVQGLLVTFVSVVAVIGVAAALATIEPMLVPFAMLTALPMVIARRRSTNDRYLRNVDLTSLMRQRQRLRRLLTDRDEAKEVRAFGLTTFLLGRHDTLTGVWQNANRDLARRHVRRIVVATAVSAVVSGGAITLLVLLITHDRLDTAGAAAAGMACYLLTSRLDNLASGIGTVHESAVFLQDYVGFLEHARTRRESDDHAAPGRVEPFERVTAEGVTFQYPGSPVAALRGVSMSVAKGEVVALVGENGSGKTTLAKLLAHLYRPGSGRIVWKGVDTSTLSPLALRDQIAIVFQDFIHYPMSAAENVSLGRVERAGDRDAVLDASERAGSHDFLSSLPSGYETILSKEFSGGSELSLGQWQRVALARAIFRDAPLLILDEPTAALDARAESALFESLRETCAGRAVLLISHRFSTVRSADRIYVLKDGEIVEHGTHEQLMAESGHYAELFTLQASPYLERISAGGGTPT